MNLELFEILAQTAPNAWFQACCDGFYTGANLYLFAELKEKKLYISEENVPNEVHVDYEENLIEKLSYEQFCKLFKVRKDKFDEDEYCDFIRCCEDFPNIDYKTFMREMKNISFIEQEEYERAMEYIKNLGIISFETLVADNYTQKSVYDPVAKKYLIDMRY